MIVLIWSSNRILSDLMARNLVRRGFDVRETALAPPHAPWASTDDPDLAIVDLDSQEPELWQRAEQARAAMPTIPLVFLGHAWPAAPQLDRLRPCTYVRKPFAIDTLLAAVQDAPMNVKSSR